MRRAQLLRSCDPGRRNVSSTGIERHGASPRSPDARAAHGADVAPEHGSEARIDGADASPARQRLQRMPASTPPSPGAVASEPEPDLAQPARHAQRVGFVVMAACRGGQGLHERVWMFVQYGNCTGIQWCVQAGARPTRNTAGRTCSALTSAPQPVRAAAPPGTSCPGLARWPRRCGRHAFARCRRTPTARARCPARPAWW